MYVLAKANYLSVILIFCVLHIPKYMKQYKTRFIITMCLIQSGSEIVSFNVVNKVVHIIRMLYYQWNVCVGCFYASVYTTVNVAG